MERDLGGIAKIEALYLKKSGKYLELFIKCKVETILNPFIST